MNKLIITIGVASSLLTSPAEKDGTEVYHSTQLVYAMDNIEDMKEWIGEDVNNGRMSEEIAESYFETLDETHGFLLDFYNKQCK
tara:strand:+ start:110 stop:361 length:252 start_codon:yes stop_codon:yes gene_type:complete